MLVYQNYKISATNRPLRLAIFRYDSLNCSIFARNFVVLLRH